VSAVWSGIGILLAFSTFDADIFLAKLFVAVVVQTVLFTVPRLTCLADDEWLSVEAFLAVNARWQSDRLPVKNSSDHLRQTCTQGPWKVKQSGRQFIVHTDV
jgi:hypothetical protein